MVSNVRMAQIHMRLERIFTPKKGQTFGKQNILLFGDLLQLKPVKSDFCFQNLSAINKKKTFGSVLYDYNLWDEFKYYELTINQRQKDNEMYASMLARIRVGAPNENHINMLQERIIPIVEGRNKIQNAAYVYNELIKNDPFIVALFSNVKSVNKFNEYIEELNAIDSVSIVAQDVIPSSMKLQARKNKKKNKINITKKTTQQTAGLESILKIGVSSRVMLKRNTDVEIGLVNGAIGTVISINKNPKNNEIKTITIKFDKINENIDVTRISAQYEYNKKNYMTRYQFPLCLAWALTIHKTQGLSLDSAIVDIGSEIFEAGMSYVALSRVRKLSNLFLISFDPTKLYCSQESIIEYNRLVKEFGKGNKIENYNTIVRTTQKEISGKRWKRY